MRIKAGINIDTTVEANSPTMGTPLDNYQVLEWRTSKTANMCEIFDDVTKMHCQHSTAERNCIYVTLIRICNRLNHLQPSPMNERESLDISATMSKNLRDARTSRTSGSTLQRVKVSCRRS
ncbi:hypothetical protein QC760_005347 [Botrytis cinerea]